MILATEPPRKTKKLGDLGVSAVKRFWLRYLRAILP